MYRLIKLNANKEIVLDIRALFLLIAGIFATNYFTYQFFGSNIEQAMWGKPGEELYLLDKAGQHIEDTHAFAQKVRQVSTDLAVPAEWLMAVMYAESRFNASVANHKGSGAVGLIQFMPATIKDYGTSTSNLKTMSADRQMDYVYKYLDRVRNKYGAYDNLTDLYLANSLSPRPRRRLLLHALRQTFRFV